jgi:hypothetical protein
LADRRRRRAGGDARGGRDRAGELARLRADRARAPGGGARRRGRRAGRRHAGSAAACGSRTAPSAFWS